MTELYTRLPPDTVLSKIPVQFPMFAQHPNLFSGNIKTFFDTLKTKFVIIVHKTAVPTSQTAQHCALWVISLRAALRNYHYSLRNYPEERSSLLLRGGSLKSRTESRVSDRKIR